MPLRAQKGLLVIFLLKLEEIVLLPWRVLKKFLTKGQSFSFVSFSLIILIIPNNILIITNILISNILTAYKLI